MIMINGKRLCDCTENEINETYVGKRYGRAVVTRVYRKLVKRPSRYVHEWYAEIICDCGNRSEKLLRHLEEGAVSSCGCNLIRNMIYNRKTNRYQINPDDTVDVIASNNPNIVFKVDLYTWIWFSNLLWGIDGNGYMTANIKGYPINYHTLLYPNPSSKKYRRDHISKCKLDNRYANLRVITAAGNVINRDKVRRNGTYTVDEIGVHKRPDGLYIAGFTSKKNNICLHKSFHSLEDAVAQRKEWEAAYQQIEEIKVPPLILPDGSLNVYSFPFDWYDADKYSAVWAYLGLRVWPYPIHFSNYINTISNIYRTEN